MSRRLTDEEIREHARKVAESLPPLTPQQEAVIAAAFRHVKKGAA